MICFCSGRKENRGFTLAELAIVLVIVALLSGGLMMSVSSQIELRARSDTLHQLQEIREALLGYAAAHNATDLKPYLPCPDIDGDGIENRTGNACTLPAGQLPWVDLGLGSQDAWGNRFDYHVHPAFSRNDTGFTLTSNPDIKVCEQAACATLLANALPLLVLSHGPNGFGARSISNTAKPAPSSADEIENANADRVFVSHVPSPVGANEFDDLLAWLSPNILYNRMIAAGKLP